MVGKTTGPSIPFDPPCNCLDLLELLERSALSVLGVLLLGRDARLPKECSGATGWIRRRDFEADFQPSQYTTPPVPDFSGLAN